MAKNGHLLKLTAEEVWDYLSDQRWHTVGEVAASFEVCKATVRSRINVLQEAGHCLVCGRDGWRLIDDTNIDKETAEEWNRAAEWIRASLGRLATIAKPMKKRSIMAAIRRALPTTPGERQTLRAIGVMLQRVVDAALIEEEDDESDARVSRSKAS